MATCILCGSEATTHGNGAFNVIDVRCPVCGHFIYDMYFDRSEYKNEMAAYLYHRRIREGDHADQQKRFYLGSQEYYDSLGSIRESSIFISDKEACVAFPSSFSKKVDEILSTLERHPAYIGQQFRCSHEELTSMLFTKRFFDSDIQQERRIEDIQNSEMLNYLSSKNYIWHRSTGIGPYDLKLLPDGLSRIDHVQAEKSNGRTVFVAMRFGDETIDTRKAIRKGIVSAGYSPVFIDEVKHGEQIIPVMLRQIQEARMLVIDVSIPNYGAYYEAGFAQGLNKKVLFCCNKDVFDGKAYKYIDHTVEEEKTLTVDRPHFDVAQRQMLLWANHEKLTEGLREWVKFFLG